MALPLGVEAGTIFGALGGLGEPGGMLSGTAQRGAPNKTGIVVTPWLARLPTQRSSLRQL